MRLDRFVSDATGVSRSEARRIIRDGRVSLSGTAIQKPSASVAPVHEVRLDGDQLVAMAPRYLMLNKPKGKVCTAVGADPRSVLRLVPQTGRVPLQCVGRLDVDTTGLLLLTDDGQWNRRMSRPGHLLKLYRVDLAKACTDAALARLLGGVDLKCEQKVAVAKSVEVLGETRVEIAVDEGRYHLIKRMFAAVGNRVLQLHRISVGSVRLDHALQPGQWRTLTDSERLRD